MRLQLPTSAERATSLKVPLFRTETHSRVKLQYFTHKWNCWVWNNRQLLRWTLDPLQWPILNPLEHEFDSVALPHYRTRQTTSSILLAANNRLLRVTRNIHTAHTIQSSLCAGSCNNHCASEERGWACTSHPKDQDWTHSSKAIMGFKVGYWVNERELRP
jgi:hypothetical protein